MEMEMAPFEVLPFLQKAIELNRPYCEVYGCKLELRPLDSSSPAQVKGDENRLLQVMSNLISNAAKFTHASDTVEIHVLQKDDQVQVGVTDHGPGIPQDKLKDLFTKFKQLSKDSNAKAPGTGLGLSICKLIVEQHGGNIGCESVPGKHTTFQFTLPA